MNVLFYAGIISQYFHEPYGSLVNGIIFGIPFTANKIFQTELKNVGLIHIVVLSGMNLSIVCAFVSTVTARFSKLVSIMITILIVVLYTVFVGFQAPIVRSLITNILTNVSI